MNALPKLRAALHGLGDEELLTARAVAFAIVAVADGNLTDAEVRRAQELLHSPDEGSYRGAPERAARTVADFETALRNVAAELVQNEDGAHEAALEVLRAVSSNLAERESVVRTAQAAIVADGKLNEREELALGTICKALGLESSKY
jgi:tellurite resistance protein